MYSQGFRRYTTSPGVNYWHRPSTLLTSPSTPQSKSLPVVFFHGVGPGMWIYLPFLLRLWARHLDRDHIVVETPHITTSLAFKVPHWTHMVKAVEEALDRHDMPTFCAMGHSFGTITAGWMARDMPHRVQQLVLVDPVCFLLG